MKALEEKIDEIIEDYQHVSWVNQTFGFDGASEAIAQEVKDIAIEFAHHFEDYVTLLYNGKDIPSVDSSELFNQFIKERYSK